MGGVRIGFLTTLGVGVGFFCPTPTPDVQLDHFLHHTLKLGIPVEMVQFLLKFLLKQRFLAVHYIILTVKFHSLYVKKSESESGVGNFGKVGVGVGYFTSDSAILHNCKQGDLQSVICSATVVYD